MHSNQDDGGQRASGARGEDGRPAGRARGRGAGGPGGGGGAEGPHRRGVAVRRGEWGALGGGEAAAGARAGEVRGAGRGGVGGGAVPWGDGGDQRRVPA